MVIVLILLILFLMLITERFVPGVVFKPSVLDICRPSPAAPNVVYSFRYKTMRGCFNVAVVSDSTIPAGYDFVLPDPPLGTPFPEPPTSAEVYPEINGPFKTLHNIWISPDYLKSRGWLLADVPLTVYDAADIERLGSYRLKVKETSEDCVAGDWLM